MQNLKINSTSTPYWCVVVPVDAEDIVLREYDKYTVICHSMNTTAGIGKTPTSLIRVNKNAVLLGCITSSGMDEGVREMVGKIHVEEMPSPYNDMSGGFHYDYIDYMNQGDYAGWQGEANSFRNPHPSALSLLTHNQITLTADQKAVVVKKIT